jgi:hypothetical protein
MKAGLIFRHESSIGLPYTISLDLEAFKELRSEFITIAKVRIRDGKLKEGYDLLSLVFEMDEAMEEEPEVDDERTDN